MENIQVSIIKSLVNDHDYCKTVLPYLQKSMFDGGAEYFVSAIRKYSEMYQRVPNYDTLALMAEKRKFNEVEKKNIDLILEELAKSDPKSLPETKWLIKETEDYCKSRLLYDAAKAAIDVYDKGSEGLDGNIGKLSKLFDDAASFSLDSNAGHDYWRNIEDAWLHYTSEVERIPFDLEVLNYITRGGLPKKTLTSIMADTNVGKSLILCHLSAAWMRAGKNVLYISMEMSEEMLRERIDVNILDMDLDDIPKMSKNNFLQKLNRIKAGGCGRLIIKNYPTGSAHVGHFRHLLNELKLKEKFKPDVICLDYLNICTSSKFSSGGNMNSYSWVKAIAEEVRGLAVEFNLPIVTATQSNRGGSGKESLELSDISESYGTAQTVDALYGVSAPPEAQAMNILKWVQLKSRFVRKNTMTKFDTGVNYDRMRIYDTESSILNMQNIMGKRRPVEEREEPEASLIKPTNKVDLSFLSEVE